MKFSTFVSGSLYALAAFALTATAVTVGDEEYQTDTTGRFLVFADKVIHVINPVTLSIEANITADQAGNPLDNAGAVGSTNKSRTWNDAVFVADKATSSRYVHVNEADSYQDVNGTQYAYVSTIDVATLKIIARTRVGSRAVHLYSINSTSTAWSKSDAEGIFYVLSIASPGKVSTTKVPAFTDKPGHGKLLVNDGLYPLGYGSNVNEPVIQKFDISNKTRIGSFAYNTSLTNSSSCKGTHSLVYSRVNSHAFFECSDKSGILEWNSVKDTYVALHNITGTLAVTPNDDRVFVTSNSNSSSTILLPGGNGETSTVLRVISVASQPGDPVFYSNSSSTGPAADYTAFFPTARNTNLNNIKGAEAAGGSVTDATYASMPSDCSYSTAATVSASSVSSSSSATGLLLATASNGSLLTPTCGACAAGINTTDPSQFNASLAGFGVIDLVDVTARGDVTATTLLSAGAVRPTASSATGANQCSFASASRAAKRGGSFVVTVADLPQPSLYIIDASLTDDALYGRGYVATAVSPKKVVYVPSNGK